MKTTGFDGLDVFGLPDCHHFIFPLFYPYFPFKYSINGG
jgi:hypothetical protein